MNDLSLHSDSIIQTVRFVNIENWKLDDGNLRVDEQHLK